MKRRLLCIVWLWLAALSAAAQPNPAPPPGNHSREVHTYSLPPEKLARAVQYARARRVLHFFGVAYGVLVLAGMIALGLASRFRDWAERASRSRLGQAYIFGTLVLLVADIASLPVLLYDQHLSLAFDQSIQTWPSWLWDWTKGELLEFAFAGLLLWIFYGVVRRSPRRWWFYFWCAAVPLLVFVMFLAPVVISPLFYRFEPLEKTQPLLVNSIARVVERGGLDIPRTRMFEMNASEKLKSLNAYVAGIGASKRVVVWDTTTRSMNMGEILFVFGHEMGHYVLGHIWVMIAANCLVMLVSFGLGKIVVDRALARWGPAWRIAGVEDWASLPVLLLVASVFGFLAEPPVNSLSRLLEHNADTYGLEVIHGIVPESRQAAAKAFQILGEISLSDPNPGPFIQFWLYDHPPVGDRTRYAAGYDPWGTGIEPKYIK